MLYIKYSKAYLNIVGESLMTSELQFYRVNKLTKILSVSRATIYNWLNKGTFPKPIKISDSVTVWRKSDIEDWISSKV